MIIDYLEILLLPHHPGYYRTIIRLVHCDHVMCIEPLCTGVHSDYEVFTIVNLSTCYKG